MSKPTLRIIHHLTCSGGLFLSESIAAMPNAYLLNEVHPCAGSSCSYSSSDLLRSTNVENLRVSGDVSEELFVSSIRNISRRIKCIGGELIIRDNSYIDYFYTAAIKSKSIVRLLEDDFNIISIVFFRDALDTYASIAKEEFHGGTKLSFEEFCKRANQFLDDYGDADLFRYESLCFNEYNTLRTITHSLNMQFSERYRLTRASLGYCKFDTWRESEVDRYGSKLDTRPSLETVGSSHGFTELQKRVKNESQKLILIATLPRSGSTWLFNCVCEIHKIIGKKYYSCWVEDYDPGNESVTHIVKMHEPEHRLSLQADTIISTRRDIRDIVGSLMRMGWLIEGNVVATVEHLINNVHPFWNEKSDLEIEYPDIIDNPKETISRVGKCLKFDLNDHEIRSIQVYLDSLSSPKKYDKNTQLHPNHRATKETNYADFFGEKLSCSINDVAEKWLVEQGFQSKDK